MDVSAFYENIRTGAEFCGVTMTEAVAMLREAGLNGIYVCLDSLRDFMPEIEAVMENTGVRISGLHAWIDLDRNPEGYKELVDAAVNVNTDNVLIVPYCSEAHTEGPMKTLLDGVQAAVAYGREHGIKVCMEDMDRLDSPYNSVAGLENFLSHIPGLYCCFDTGNFIMHQEDELEAFQHFQSRVCAMHLKDRTRKADNADDIGRIIADGSVRYPCPVGSGFIRIKEILELSGNIPLIAELYDYSPEHMLEGLRKSVEWIVNLLKKNP